jgi:hypothetical protein
MPPRFAYLLGLHKNLVSAMQELVRIAAQSLKIGDLDAEGKGTITPDSAILIHTKFACQSCKGTLQSMNLCKKDKTRCNKIVATGQRSSTEVTGIHPSPNHSPIFSS